MLANGLRGAADVDLASFGKFINLTGFSHSMKLVEPPHGVRFETWFAGITVRYHRIHFDADDAGAAMYPTGNLDPLAFDSHHLLVEKVDGDKFSNLIRPQARTTRS